MIEVGELCNFYEHDGHEELRLGEHSLQRLEFDTAIRYLERYLPPDAHILDSCAGSGIYSFHFAQEGHSVVAGDIVPYNVELILSRQAEQAVLENVYQGDARSLKEFDANSFDAVLCMGALYHMDDAEDRRQIVNESMRVLREDGIFACTYMNRHAVIMNNITPHLDNMEEILSFLKSGSEGIFYASTPEETTRLLTECGVEIQCHVALDGLTTFLFDTTGVLNQNSLTRWQQLHLEICEIPSLLGYGYHNMIIGKKAKLLFDL